MLCRVLESVFLVKVWNGLIDSFCQLWQFDGRHCRKEVMLQVIKHAEGDFILPTATLGSGKIRVIIGMVMHRPYSKESHQEFGKDHDNDVIDEKVNIEVQGYKQQCGHGGELQ